MKRLAALIGLTIGRARATPALILIRLIGTVLAVTLTCGVSLYSSAMGDAMLQSNIGRDVQSRSIAVSVTSQTLTPATYSRLDGYVRSKLAGDLDLPVMDVHVHHNTAAMPFYRGDRPLRAQQHPLATLSADYYEGLAAQVTVVEGSLTPARAPGGAVPVAVSFYTAHSLGVGVGSRLYVSVDGKKSTGPPLVVTAVFAPRDSASQFWDVSAGLASYRSIVVPRPDDFLRLQSLDPSLMPSFLWRYDTDIHAVKLANAPQIIDALTRIGSKVSAISDGATLIQSLSLDLSGFLNDYALLPFILYVLVAPIAAVVLNAVAVTTSMVVARQANEIVLMRSRGAGSGQIGLLYALEGLGVGVVATVIGPLLGLPVARLIGHTSGFLTFSGGLPFAVTLDPRSYLIAAVTAVIAFMICILPALNAARRSMISFKQTQARSTRRPLWQRLFLDVIMLAVALYGYWVLQQQGSITSESSSSALAQDPVIGLAPLAFAVGIALLLTRMLPWLAAFALVLGSRSSASFSVALQSVARSPRQPMRLVQLLVLTLTLGVFAATVAGVVGANASDQVMYGAGSTLRLQEFNLAIKAFQAYPLGWHLRRPGVQAASMALRLESTNSAPNTTGDGSTTVNVLGIDPPTLQNVMWFRSDFATEPLPRLLGHVADTSARNAIVSDTFLGATGLHLGDSFDIVVSSGRTIHGRVAAHAAYFPTLDPTQYPFVIFNVNYLNTAIHGHGPSEAWIKTRADPAHVATMLEQFRAALPREVFAFQGVPAPFSAGDDPLRAGVYGVVSVGFLIAMLLALLGFLTYASLALQYRVHEFAVLRALGLSSAQLRWLLLGEHLFMVAAGICGGLVSGILTSRLFLPYLPIASSIMPPFLITIAWGAVEEFLAAILIVFILVLSIYAGMLVRLPLSRVLRLGEG